MPDSANLAQTANSIRQSIIKMLVSAGSGHSAGPLGMADVFTALYFKLLKQNPKNPNWSARDRLFVSCGHICPVWYATLAEAGYFPKEELMTLRQVGSRLQGHPHRTITNDQLSSFRPELKPKVTKQTESTKAQKTPDQNSEFRIQNSEGGTEIPSIEGQAESRGVLPGIENTSGPLGQGVSQAVGLALAAKIDKVSWQTICITSDGEQQEGQVWEAYQLASKYHLGNLTFILDRNNIQIDGPIHEVMPLEPLKAKYEAFGLIVLEIDGHNFEEIEDAYYKALAIHDRPVMIIAHTIPGKDVEFMENLSEWHGKTPNPGETVEALRELRTLSGQLEWES